MSRIRKTPSLLARLRKARDYALHGDDAHPLASKFDCIESTLQHMEKSLLQIKNWEMRVVEQLGKLDDEIPSCEYDQPWESRVGDKLKLIEADVGKLKSLISTVEYQSASPSPSKNYSLNNDDDGQSVAQETADHVGEDKVLESKTMSFLSEYFHCLEGSLIKKCLVLLSVFPENEAIEKKPLIYWWIGEGLVNKRSNATAQEVGEQIFQELLNHSIIKPITRNSITRNSFTVYPRIRQMLIQLAQKNSLLEFEEETTKKKTLNTDGNYRRTKTSLKIPTEFPSLTPRNAYGRAFLWRGKDQSHAMDPNVDLVTIYNMTEKYLGSSPELLSIPRKLKVLQMGRWQDSATHHIEAEDYEKLFERLGSQKHLEYLSLRGISRIETLPQSIGKLKKLLILDLRACHNLIKLPKEVADLRSLTHLDVSECYLLDSMPKGLQRLSNLQVLKGFVVSNSRSCKIYDLSGLAHLRKLGIRVGSLGKEQLQSLGAGFKGLHILTVLWSEASPDGVTVVSLPKTLKRLDQLDRRSVPFDVESLPKTLIKLDLRSVPFYVVPPWMEPSQLPQLEKLYIKGGQLSSLNSLNNLNNHDKYVSVKSIRLNYLENLKINQEDLLTLFPNLVLNRCIFPGKSA